MIMGMKMPDIAKQWKSPLAALLRPQHLSEIIGQRHLLSNGKLLQRMAETRTYQSTIFWGPPGTGKTSLVRSLANDTDSNFRQLNATKATVNDLRKIIDGARKSDKRTFVFVDEIHRWNKMQQDTMLPVVEDGTIVLFGATTEKPKFAINSTLLSRCLVMEVKPLSYEELLILVVRVKNHYKEHGRKIQIDKDAAMLLISRCSGDARKVITALETCVEVLIDDDHISKEHVEVAIPEKHIVFDARGNDHFDLAHCYQEAIQHSDVDAAIYWLAKWVASGEDPAYICRRMLITAFEDCSGNPFAGPVAMAASYAVERTGLPECLIPMAQATVELAMSRRNKAAYYAIKSAMDDVNNNETIHVPPGLRAGTSGYIAAISKKYLNDWCRDWDTEAASKSLLDTINDKTESNSTDKGVVYCVGVSDSCSEMVYGPSPDLNEMLQTIGEDGLCIIRFVGRCADVVFRWNSMSNTWVKNC